MERAHQKHVLVLITNPFAVINVVHSGLMAELGKHYRITVMSDLLTTAEIERFNRHFKLNMHWLHTPFPPISKFAKWLRAIQMLFFGHFFGLETIRIKVRERGAVLHWFFCISRKNLALTYLTGSLVVIIRNWLIRRTMLHGFHTSVAGANFHAVISTSPLDLRENAVANSLKVRGALCVSMIISWDNLTSKGVINAKSDLVLVWNNKMAVEYQQLYSMFSENAAVRISGTPRFDAYSRKLADQDVHLHKLSGVDSSKRVILFTTGAVKHHSCQKYIIEDLLRYAKIRPDIAILVRCHPGDDLRRYDCFKSVRNLHICQPFGQGGSIIPPVDFLEKLHCQLARCQVCVQIASTMLLDASAMGKPCISIAYDAHPGLHYISSVKRFYDYSHQLMLPDCLKANRVHSRGELFAKLDQALAGTCQTTGIENAATSFIHHGAPDAVGLTAHYIREWLG